MRCCCSHAAVCHRGDGNILCTAHSPPGYRRWLYISGGDTVTSALHSPTLEAVCLQRCARLILLPVIKAGSCG